MVWDRHDESLKVKNIDIYKYFGDGLLKLFGIFWALNKIKCWIPCAGTIILEKITFDFFSIITVFDSATKYSYFTQSVFQNETSKYISRTNQNFTVKFKY